MQYKQKKNKMNTEKISENYGKIEGEPLEILLVEDDLAHAEIVKRNFLNFRVANNLHHVEDGEEALDFLFCKNKYAGEQSAKKPHIILLDLRLPKVDGMEILKIIKEDKNLSVIPVVILTTSEIETDVIRAYQYHANSYLVKPIDFNKFVQLMQTFGYYWLAWNKFPFK
jgi:CheY-like chemotaxis protein